MKSDYYLSVCKETTPQQYYQSYGFNAVEEAYMNLKHEESKCITGQLDGRKLKTYLKLIPLWKKFYDSILPNHINESYYQQ